MSFSRLPNELLIQIAGNLHMQDIAFLRSTNKYMAGVLHLSLYDSIYTSGSADAATKALYYAAARKNSWLVSRLIKQNVHTLVNDGPLISNAVRRFSTVETIRIFLDCGAEVNAVDHFGSTALAAAAARGRLDLVELLLSRGAEIKIHKRLACPLWQAARSGHSNIFQLLHYYPGVNLASVDSYGRGLLHWFACSNSPEVVRMLIQNTANDVNRRDLGGSTPLCVAAEMRHTHIAWTLLSCSRTDVNLGDAFGNTPLHKAVRHGHIGLIRMLMEDGRVDATTTNSDGKTPLMVAQSSGRRGVIKLLAMFMS